MSEDEVQDLRRKRLADWIKANGGAHAICKKRDLGKKGESYISQLIGGYSFGSRAARNMEKKLGIEDGFLDGQVKPSSNVASLSPDALMLARWFDRLTDGQDRSEAYFTATEAIVLALDKRDPQPTHKPARPVSQEKQPV